MSRFRISSHGRLQDWIAVERRFCDEEGLDYEFDVRVLENAAQDISAEAQQDIRVRAYELYLSGISRWDRRSLFRSRRTRGLPALHRRDVRALAALDAR